MIPEVAEELRDCCTVQPERGGRITEVRMRLSNGRQVRFFELAHAGRTHADDSHAALLRLARIHQVEEPH